MTVSNDAIWSAYKKDYDWPSQGGDNALFSQVVEAGTGYHTYGVFPTPGALEKTRNIIDRLFRIFSGGPAMSLEESRDFALWNRLYAESEYEGPSGAGAQALTVAKTQVSAEALPVAVRVISELVEEVESVRDAVRSDLRFLGDLWNELFSPTPGTDWASYTVETTGAQSLPPASLKEIWVDGKFGIIPWYPVVQVAAGTDPAVLSPMPLDIILSSPAATAQVSMPAGRSLIDFLWTETRVGSIKLGDAVTSGGLTDDEVLELQKLRDQLILWEAGEPPESEPNYAQYRLAAGSAAAALYATYGLGFNAGKTNDSLNYQAGLRWCPVFGDSSGSGVVSADVDMTQLVGPDGTLGPTLATSFAPGSGDLPVELDEDEQTIIGPGGSPAIGKILLNIVAGYGPLRDMAFPQNTFASMASTAGGDDVNHGILAYPEPPMEALYETDDDGLVHPLTVRGNLSQANVNDLTRFFLELGRYYNAEADKPLGVGPSNKSSVPVSPGDPIEYKPSDYPDHYPLTRSLARLATLRRLLEAGRFLRGNFDGVIPTYGEVFRSRAFDLFLNQQPLPVEGSEPVLDVAADGGVLRAPGTFPDIDDQSANEKLAEGFQQRMWNLGGSVRPIVTFFAEQGAGGGGKPPGPASFFWNIPGQALSGGGTDSPSSHVADMVIPSANRDLQSTHFADYQLDQNKSPDFEHPYTLDVPLADQVQGPD